MKIKHLLLGAALVAAIGACSANVTEPAARAGGPLRTEKTPTSATSATSATDTTNRDGGLLGSGGG